MTSIYLKIALCMKNISVYLETLANNFILHFSNDYLYILAITTDTFVKFVNVITILKKLRLISILIKIQYIYE